MIDTQALREKNPSDAYEDDEVFACLDEIDRLRALLADIRAAYSSHPAHENGRARISTVLRKRISEALGER